MRRAGCRWGWHWVSQAENAPHLCPAPAGEPPAFFNVVHTPWLCGTDSRGDLPPLGGLSPLHVLRPPHLAPAAEPLLDSPTCSAATAWSWTRCCCTGRCSSGGACSPATSSQRPSRRRVARLVAGCCCGCCCGRRRACCCGRRRACCCGRRQARCCGWCCGWWWWGE